MLLAEIMRGHKSIKEHKAKGKKRVSISMSYPSFSTKGNDKDNRYAQAKLLLDAMTELGLIMDDAPEYIDLTVEKGKGPKRTVVRVAA
jgi:Holliday junction resolvase RusA-like endonuclease